MSQKSDQAEYIQIDPNTLTPGDIVVLRCEKSKHPEGRNGTDAMYVGRSELAPIYGFEVYDTVFFGIARDDGTLRDDQDRVVEVLRPVKWEIRNTEKE